MRSGGYPLYRATIANSRVSLITVRSYTISSAVDRNNVVGPDSTAAASTRTVTVQISSKHSK